MQHKSQNTLDFSKHNGYALWKTATSQDSSSASFWFWPHKQPFIHQLCGHPCNSCGRRKVRYPKDMRKMYRKLLTDQSISLQSIQVLLFCPDILTDARKSITRQKGFGAPKKLNAFQIFLARIAEDIRSNFL